MERKAPLAILALVAIVGLFSILYHFWIPTPSPAAVVVSVGMPTGADTIRVPDLEINQWIWRRLQSVGETQLTGLRGGTIIGARRTNYRQYIRTGGGTTGFNGGRIEFVTDERGKLSDYLAFKDYLFEYMIDFDGLSSELVGTRLPDIEKKEMLMLGSKVSFQDTYVNGNTIELEWFGGVGNIIFRDNDFTDNNYYSHGARINGQDIDADVRIRAITSGNEVTVYSIEYKLAADGVAGGDVYIPPERCAQDFLQYPQGMLAPNYDICYAGLGAVSSAYPQYGVTGGKVKFGPRAGTGYTLRFINVDGNLYDFNLYDTTGGAHYGDNKGRTTHFFEAPNPAAPNIARNDFFVVNSRLDINGVTNVLQYDNLDATNNKIIFKDLSGGDRTVVFNGAGQGTLNVGRGQYNFQVNIATGLLAIDLNNDGNINGGTSVVVLEGGSRLEFTPGFAIRIRTPARLRPEFLVDEVTNMNFVGNDINIPSPQGIFQMEGIGDSVYQGMTQYGILVTQDMSNTPSKVELTVPGAGGVAAPVRGGAMSGVLFTLERARLQMGAEPTPQAPTGPACGNGKVDPGEECDPPGKLLKATKEGREILGICAAGCKAKWFMPQAECGNGIIENGEECEKAADCGPGYKCEACKCVQPIPVCGNGILEVGEQCEFDSQCAEGLYCGNCMCKIRQIIAPEQQAPAKGGFFYNIWLWIKKLFGG